MGHTRAETAKWNICFETLPSSSPAWCWTTVASSSASVDISSRPEEDQKRPPEPEGSEGPTVIGNSIHLPIVIVF